MKVLITGAHGLLGSEFVAALVDRGDVVAPLGRADLDVTDAGLVLETVRSLAPDVVVHCAAWTAVDAAEEHPDEAMRVNRDGARNVAEASVGAGARVVYISTDYVYDGSGREPHRPEDPVSPASVYARTKLAGEDAVAGATEGRALVVRTGWLYGAAGKNFVDSMIGHGRKGSPLRVVGDQVGRPTWARNVARVVLELLDTGADGIWHVADGGTASWHELAEEAFAIVGIDTPIASTSTEEWGAAAPRPRYSVLDLARTEARVGHAMQPWPEALREYLAGRGAAADAESVTAQAPVRSVAS